MSAKLTEPSRGTYRYCPARKAEERVTGLGLGEMRRRARESGRAGELELGAEKNEALLD